MTVLTHLVFKDRTDAGKRLAKLLHSHAASDSVILAIPRGGIPIAAAAAQRLKLDWGVIVARKLPVPWNPEAGFGAITVSGAMALNEPMVSGLQLRKAQIDEIASKVLAEVRRRTDLYMRERPSVDIAGRTAIVVDDGLASGYTMLAAVRSLRAMSPERIIAAAPVASRSAARMMEDAADECVFEVVSPSVPFAVADFYLAWHDLTDEDILPLLSKSV